MLSASLIRSSVIVAALTVAPIAHADDDDPLAWRWRRFQPVEGALTVAGGVASVGLYLTTVTAPTRTSGPILFDRWARDHLAASTPEGRQHAQIVSTIPYWTGLSYPLLVDALAVTWLGRSHGDTALQMAMIDAEAYAYAGVLSFGANTIVRRARPEVSDCLKRGGTEATCGGPGDSASVSFYSGHTSLAFTGAGLTCAHHRNLPLYGGIGDGLVCALLIAASSVDAVGRIVADKHYATDVLVGASVGLSVGYLTPALLHYRYPVERTGGFVILPSFSPGFAGIAATKLL